MKTSLIVFLTLTVFAVNAEVYKWVDEHGVTHYGAKKPEDTGSEQLDIKESGSAKPLSGEAKEFAKAIAGEILRDHGDASELNCKQAVFNAKSSIDNMLQVGKKNYNDGFIDDARYREASAELKRIKGVISLSECQGSEGNVLGFYKCMSNNANHVVTCGEKYNYQDND